MEQLDLRVLQIIMLVGLAISIFLPSDCQGEEHCLHFNWELTTVCQARQLTFSWVDKEPQWWAHMIVKSFSTANRGPATTCTDVQVPCMKRYLRTHTGSRHHLLRYQVK